MAPIPHTLAAPLGVIAVLGALAIQPAIARAQSPADTVPSRVADPAPVCYGFSFGVWTPALDRVAAGHDPEARAGPGAPDGRAWAASDSGSESSLILFPGWWPAGVRVTLPSSPPRVGQTAKGKAIALVADARRRPPTADITVHGVPCGRQAARGEPGR